MRFPRTKTSLYAVAFVLFLLVFAYLLLTYTRRVDGISMWPTLESGDLVVIQPVTMSQLQIGNVIVYGPPCSTSGESVIHRIVAGNSTGFYTQGDDRRTNPLPDEPYQWPYITAECVKGVVLLSVPYLGLISMYISYPWNYALVALILIFVFVTELSPGRKSGDQPGGSSVLAFRSGRTRSRDP